MTHHLRYAPWSRIRDYLDAGWLVVGPSPGHHAEHSALVEWLCDCPMVVPA